MGNSLKILHPSPIQTYHRLANLTPEERLEVIMHSPDPELTAENFRAILDPGSVQSDIELFGKELPGWIG